MIPDEYTTCPQAEVMIEGIVPANYIKEIHFNNNSTYLSASKDIRSVSCETMLKVDGKFFSRRQDYRNWSERS